MGKVRISRNMFVVILGVFIWLVSAMIATAAENPETKITIQEAEMSKVCTCTCTDQDDQEIIQPVEEETQDDQDIVQVVEDVQNENVDSVGDVEQDSQDLNEENVIEEEVVVEEPKNEEENPGNLAEIQVILVELYPAPLSGEIEYMKFLNDGDSSADLSGWYVMDASEKKYIFKELILLPGESFTLDYDTSRISLNNSGDTVYLYDADENLRQSVEYPAVEKATVLKYDGVNWSFGEEEDVIIAEDQGQSLQDQALEESEIMETDNQVNLVSDQVNQGADPVDPIQDVIEAPSAEEENQTETQANQDESIEGESILYSPAQITEYQNWLDDSHLTVVGRVISAAGDWVDNRCYLAQENQAIPVLCTQLASEFIFGKTQSIQGEVVFKNGGFYRFDPDLLNPSEVEINLSGELLSENLEAYKIYEYQGLVRDFSEKYLKVEIETEAAGNFILRWSKSQAWEFPNEGDLIKGLAMADSKGQLWLWESWETMVEPNVLDGTMAAEAAANSEEASAEEEPELPTAYLGLGAAGILGTGKAVWTYRDALKKFLPKKFKA